MKAYIIALLLFSFGISNTLFAQDTSENQKLTQDRTYEPAPSTNEIPAPQHHIYRDTRLGSSSPLYNTYQKNDYGAGSITTNPNKGSGSTFTPAYTTPVTNTTNKSPIYRDTRLGSSSPLYNTYQKNDYGAGSITTNPNKGSGVYIPPSNITNTSPEADSSQTHKDLTKNENKH